MMVKVYLKEQRKNVITVANLFLTNYHSNKLIFCAFSDSRRAVIPLPLFAKTPKEILLVCHRMDNHAHSAI